MNGIEKIKQLYIPVQPTVRKSGGEVVYHEVIPDPILQDYIYCYWQLKTQKPLTDPFSYRVVADGCIDIFFSLNSPNESFVMGFCKEYTEFDLESSFNYIGIRFYPTMFPQLFNINAADLSNRYEELELVLPDIAQFVQTRFDNTLNLSEIKGLLDNFFSQWMVSVKINADSRLYNALSVILENQGTLNIESDIDVGISHRQLRRLFNYYIGDSVKTFSRVVRFQNILKAKPSVQSLKQNKLFYDVGYFDQTHFIKDFKNFYGVTPTQAFR